MTWTRWKGLLALAVLTSITGNVMHAVLVAPTVYGWGAAFAASIAPVFLFWHTHNLITSPQGLRRGDWVGAAVISMIALGAFAVSFMGLRELLITFGFTPAIAVILPLVVDVTIAGASWELVREGRGADHDVDRRDHLEDLSLILDARTAIGPDHAADLPVIAADAPSVPAAQGALAAGSALIGEPADNSPSELADDQSRAPAPESDPRTDHRQIAERIAASGRTQQPIDVIAAVLAARAEGMGQRTAGAAAGVSQGAVRKIEEIRDEIAGPAEPDTDGREQTAA